MSTSIEQMEARHAVEEEAIVKEKRSVHGEDEGLKHRLEIKLRDLHIEQKKELTALREANRIHLENHPLAAVEKQDWQLDAYQCCKSPVQDCYAYVVVLLLLSVFFPLTR
jgi:hypothetical protein